MSHHSGDLNKCQPRRFQYMACECLTLGLRASLQGTLEGSAFPPDWSNDRRIQYHLQRASRVLLAYQCSSMLARRLNRGCLLIELLAMVGVWLAFSFSLSL